MPPRNVSERHNLDPLGSCPRHNVRDSGSFYLDDLGVGIERQERSILGYLIRPPLRIRSSYGVEDTDHPINNLRCKTPFWSLPQSFLSGVL